MLASEILLIKGMAEELFADRQSFLISRKTLSIDAIHFFFHEPSYAQTSTSYWAMAVHGN